MRVRWRHLESGDIEEAEAWGLAATALPSSAMPSPAARPRAQGTVRSVSGEPRLRYLLACDEAWRVRSVEVATPVARAVLEADGEGHWLRDGAAAPALEGCVDVDLETTPLTNTLPIRRLGLRPGQSRQLRVAYVRVPSLEVLAVPQTYTCLQAGKRYRYEGHPPGFSAEITVDGHGLVVDYPGLFQRD